MGEVVRAWAGLGYNRRAVHLHATAVVVVERHGGTLPDELDALLALPGVGPYTARAVLAFAFERDVGVVDTNAARVLARRAGRSLDRAAVQAQADAAVPAGRGWAWNQAMLDLGATTCRARSPGCDVCPVARGCAWWEAGRPEPDPARGSAGVSTGQSRFEGSDRQGRGRLVDALRGAGARRARRWPRRPAGPTTRPAPRSVAADAGARRPGRRATTTARSGCPERSAQAVRCSTIRRFTTSGCSSCRKWPASATISTREPSAGRNARAPSASDAAMQPSSTPCR